MFFVLKLPISTYDSQYFQLFTTKFCPSTTPPTVLLKLARAVVVVSDWFVLSMRMQVILDSLSSRAWLQPLYSQLSPCEHPANTDIRNYGQNSDPRVKRFD